MKSFFVVTSYVTVYRILPFCDEIMFYDLKKNKIYKEKIREVKKFLHYGLKFFSFQVFSLIRLYYLPFFCDKLSSERRAHILSFVIRPFTTPSEKITSPLVSTPGIPPGIFRKSSFPKPFCSRVKEQ